MLKKVKINVPDEITQIRNKWKGLVSDSSVEETPTTKNHKKSNPESGMEEKHSIEKKGKSNKASKDAQLPEDENKTVKEKNISAIDVKRKAAEEKTDIPIVWQDERLTTVEADEILQEMDVPREDRKKYLDSIAASVILRDYMNNKESGEKHGSGK